MHNHSFEDHDKHLEEERKRHEELHGGGEEDDLGVGDEEETPDLLALDPKEWKVRGLNVAPGLEFDEEDRNKITMPSWAYHICDTRQLQTR